MVMVFDINHKPVNFLKMKHNLLSFFKKSIIKITMQFIKYKTKEFDDYFPCKKNKPKLNPVKQSIILFIEKCNKAIISS